MEKSTNTANPEIAKNLGLDQTTSRGRMVTRLIVSTAIAAAVIVGVILWRNTQTTPTVQFKTQEVRRGDLVVTVTATGNLQPTNLVDIGIEVSGTVATVDVDHNDQVRR
ncbi:MAG TPA: efflux RND transporter periplasmic adaptor subunit, partial [candidate division Zixibacteria bacterium]|nr:efflux RND transporter periplasmic adaptor subunit [candidate division Zixibacteria bacterium]